MKINFPLKHDGNIHRYCINCGKDGMLYENFDGIMKNRCLNCKRINNRSIYLDKHKFWIDDDKELWHESVGIFVKNKNNEYLLLKRNSYPISYTIPAGHIDLDEESLTAAKRELKEETSLDNDLIFVDTLEIPGDLCSAGADYHVWHIYTTTYDETTDKLIVNPTEGSQPIWSSPQNSLKYKLAFATEFLIKKYYL